MPAILTLPEYKTRRQITEASQERDEALTAALAAAEDAVLQYTTRDFTTAEGVETREYPWEVHTTILETDDFVGKPSAIAFEIPGVGATNIYPVSAFWVGPREGPTHYYIDFTPSHNLSLPGIGAMGFERNLDTFFARGGTADAVTAHVTAEFGWPGESPASVKQAVTWLVDEFYSQPPGGTGAGAGQDIQAEGIADLTYAYQREPTKERTATLPPRVQQLLDPYRRIAL